MIQANSIIIELEIFFIKISLVISIFVPGKLFTDFILRIIKNFLILWFDKRIN